MKLTLIALFAVVFLANVAEAKPLKYGIKGANKANSAQEVATKGSADLDKIKPAAGDVDKLKSGSTLNRRFKNK